MGQLGSIYLDIRNWLQQQQNELVWVTESQGEFQNQKHPLPELVRNADLPSPLFAKAELCSLKPGQSLCACSSSGTSPSVRKQEVGRAKDPAQGIRACPGWEQNGKQSPSIQSPRMLQPSLSFLRSTTTSREFCLHVHYNIFSTIPYSCRDSGQENEALSLKAGHLVVGHWRSFRTSCP